MEQLALFGGEKVVKNVPDELFKWPIITEEDEAVWLAACSEFEFFREGFYDFDYRAYYEALHRMRGALARRSGGKMPLGRSPLRSNAEYSILLRTA